MRQVVLDTETTGLNPDKGHRLIEIGCIELVERRRSGARLHTYLNPQREIDQGALEVHGLTEEFLRDKPRFADVVDELLKFIDGAELIIHNAAFDLSFLDCELALLGTQYGRVRDRAEVLDTLTMARERFPGQKNSLDALCKRFAIDNSHRELHGALLDASLLTDVYLAMTAGQGALDLALESARAPAQVRQRRELKPVRLRTLYASTGELALHEARLRSIEKTAKRAPVWRQLVADPV